MSESTHIDINDEQIYGQDGVNLDDLDQTQIDATAFDAIEKISHSTNVSGVRQKIAQGNENAIDINVCAHIGLSGDFGLPDMNGKTGRSDQVITVKGGSSYIRLGGPDSVIHSHPTRCKAHIQFGNHSDQSRALTRHCSCEFKHADGGPVYYSTGWTLPFTIHGKGNCKWLFWESMELKVYVLFKLIVRVILRIPPGVKGPDWL